MSVLTDAVRLRDLVEWVGSLDGKPKAPGFDERSYFRERVKGVALIAVAEAHLVLFGSVDVGECHHVLRAAGSRRWELEDKGSLTVLRGAPSGRQGGDVLHIAE